VNRVKPFLREATSSVHLARLAPAAVFSLALGTIAACGSSKSSPGFGPTGGGGGASSGGSGDDSGILNFGDDGGIGLNLDASPPHGTPVGDAGCATAMSQAHFAAVYLLFVLDGSGSMAQNNKWTAVVPALKDIFTQMAGTNDPGLAAGLIIFSDTNDTTAGAGPYPSSADVAVGLMNSAQNTKLATRLSGMPMSGTPTQTAMTGGYTELENFQAQAPLTSGGKKVLVLITDGAPTDGCSILSSVGSSGYTSNPCVMMAASKLTEAAPKGPIETFVIGVGQFPSAIALTFDPSFLGYVAQAGGTGPAMCNPSENSTTSDLCYFEIDPTTATSATQLQQRFETALNTIRGQVASCNFPIETSGSGTIDPSKVNVEIGNMTILQDPKNGWTYDNPTKPTQIILHGAACAEAKGGITEKVQVVLGCQTQTVPM
jgi:hypothetical protein